MWVNRFLAFVGVIVKCKRFTADVFFVFLFTTVGVGGEGALIASMTGVILILLGQHIDMLEKKRGKTWLSEGEVNPHEVAFGYAHPVYVMGWLLLCMAMAIPMDV